MKNKEPKSLLQVFKYLGLGLLVVVLIARSIEEYRLSKKEKARLMSDIVLFWTSEYNYKTKPIEVWFKIDEEYMPTREKLNTYFKDEIKVEKQMYSDENTTIYLDSIKGDDNNFLRFYFTKKDKVEKNKGELVTITKETNSNEYIHFTTSENEPELYDRDNKFIGKAKIYAESHENENFTLSVNKEVLTNMNWPISFKMNLTKVMYEKKR